ncbi:MAG: bifunctional phosphoribosylaminoimidazolecarboxamide formyltransferase/IMP cyclohydrolase [Actinomycetaceae bacterium]|nr:bifunctional phosphoribosylaminoimidazolecarboxamide formyltransferase/IMP cyclohydrolase [Actinomycetaceae bacterium]
MPVSPSSSTPFTYPQSPEARIPVRRALVSVYDKTGLEELARALADVGVDIVSTGSTASRIEAAGVSVTPVDQLTGFPECLEGRVKTLHPKVHAGILADRRKTDHVQQLADLGVEAFDLVIVNLYPFAATVQSGASVDECVEQIDIGGPTMVRAAAKNYPSVAVITSPASYDAVLMAVKAGGFTLAQRRDLAAAAFEHTASYDATVASWFAEGLLTEGEETGNVSGSLSAALGNENKNAGVPRFVGRAWSLIEPLRYGENPHQAAGLYADAGITAPGIAQGVQLHGKAMSFNNYTDGDAAWRAAWDHEAPCCAIIKHANPCGIAIGADIAEAHRRAHACDPVSAFGGVIAVNREVTKELAEQIAPIFTEVVLAPSFDNAAVEVLAAKKNLRLVQVPKPVSGALEIKPISGGAVIQGCDNIDATGDDPAGWTLASGAPADAETMRDLVFAWRTVRAVKSNAILLVKDGASVGVGMGQVNRVDSCKLAIERANTLGGRASGDADASAGVDSAGGADASSILGAQAPRRSEGAVGASDAFFPFADGLQLLIDAGVKAVVQPGGSVRDDQVIEAAKAAGITMYLTGTRHFFH